MALFISSQSGNWHDPATWGGGGAPDLSIDDAMISEEHEVILESEQSQSLASGRMLDVVGTLKIQGSIVAYDSELLVTGDLIVEGGLTVSGGGYLLIDTGGTVVVVGDFVLENSASAVVRGGLTFEADSIINIFMHATFTVETGGIWDIYGYCQIIGGSQAVLYGDLQVGEGGTLYFSHNGVLAVTEDGVAHVYGTLVVVQMGYVDIFGWFGLAGTGWIQLVSQGIINVYRDIRISGRIGVGGGRIIMHRRDGRILGFNNNLLFVLDRAYGYGQTQIA